MRRDAQGDVETLTLAAIAFRFSALLERLLRMIAVDQHAQMPQALEVHELAHAFVVQALILLAVSVIVGNAVPGDADLGEARDDILLDAPVREVAAQLQSAAASSGGLPFQYPLAHPSLVQREAHLACGPPGGALDGLAFGDDETLDGLAAARPVLN